MLYVTFICSQPARYLNVDVVHLIRLNRIDARY